MRIGNFRRVRRMDDDHSTRFIHLKKKFSRASRDVSNLFAFTDLLPPSSFALKCRISVE